MFRSFPDWPGNQPALSQCLCCWVLESALLMGPLRKDQMRPDFYFAPQTFRGAHLLVEVRVVLDPHQRMVVVSVRWCPVEFVCLVAGWISSPSGSLWCWVELLFWAVALQPVQIWLLSGTYICIGIICFLFLLQFV